MKKVQQKFKFWPGLIVTMGLLAVMLSSCIKDHNNTPVQPVAAMAVIDASPDAPPLNFFLDATRVNQSALTLGNFINYFNVNTGSRSAIFNADGTGAKFAGDTINLVANHVYSLFLSNQSAHTDVILLSDSVTRPAVGMSAIRFVDLSPDAPNVDLIVKGGATLASNKTYKNISAFVPLEAKNDTIQVVKTGTTTVLATVPGSGLQSGAVYTVWFYGLANTSDTNKKLAANAMVNAYFL